MDGYESWTIKKAKHQRIDAFELWCWRRLLTVPWIARRSNQSILKEISPGCYLEGLVLKLKLQSFGQLMQRTDSFEKTLMLGKTEGRRRGRHPDSSVGKESASNAENPGLISQESSAIPQFKSISSLVLSFLYGPTLTPKHDHWKNHSFDYMDLCQQSDASSF